VPIIDGHIHLGANRHTKYYPAERMAADLAAAGADGAVVFAFPEDVYRITDTPEARAAANAYVLEVARREAQVYPFYFVWTDYALPDDLGAYAGVKWHRHADEPRYDYAGPRCEAFLQAAAALRLPITLEEELDATAAFVDRVAGSGITVIIPHLGMLNGGHRAMVRFSGCPHVCFDTSCAPGEVARWFLAEIGPRRLLFGSDVSGTAEPFFNFPRVEREKLESLGLTEEEHRLIFGENLLRLLPQ
jgi:hypothetical protein